MLRHRLAAPWLAGLRLWHAVGSVSEGFRVLLFHDIPSEQRQAFADFVAWVERANGVIGPAEAAARLDGSVPNTGRPCLFTFDDGFASNLEVARTVLAEHCMKGLFFVCPGLIELDEAAQAEAIGANIFNGKRDAGGLRLMGWDALAELKALGHTIGAHGMTHARLSTLEGQALEDEIAGSGARIAERLGDPVDWYAWAFGDVGSMTAEAMAVVGRHHRFCRSGVRGTNGPGTAALAVRADHVELEAPTAYRELVAEGGLDFRYQAARETLDGWV